MDSERSSGGSGTGEVLEQWRGFWIRRGQQVGDSARLNFIVPQRVLQDGAWWGTVQPFAIRLRLPPAAAHASVFCELCCSRVPCAERPHAVLPMRENGICLWAVDVQMLPGIFGDER
jgi:hypothetical protein